MQFLKLFTKLFSLNMYTIGGPSTTIYWGDIIGTLSSQTDLQSTLDDKASLIDLSEKSNGLEKISEEVGKTGWILKDNNGRIPANPVGDYSVDLTWQDQTAPARVVGATGNYSLAAGRNTLASGMNSTVFGDGSIASAKNSAAFGLNNTSSEDYSFSVGRGNNSSGLQSTTIGYGNTANGISSFAGGTDSAVVDNSGFGELPSPKLGLPTVPYQTGANSFVFGDSLIAANPNMTVFGSWNLDEGLDNSTLYRVFVVGIGTSNGRQNGLEVFDGSGIERGSVKAPYLQQDTIDADITGKVIITKEYFENRISYFQDAPMDGRDYVRNNKQWVLLPAAENIAQVYYKGLVPPPLPQPDPELPNSNMFDTGDVYLHYNLPTYDLIDGNLMDADGNDALWDGNSDGGLNYKQYILQDNRALPGDPSIYEWEEMTFGIQEAPAGLQYNRTLGSWAPAAIQLDAPADGTPYSRQDNAWVQGSGGQIVYKGSEDPTTLSDFGEIGDNYMKEGGGTPPNNYVIDLYLQYGEGNRYLFDNKYGNIISGTPDVQEFWLYQGYEMRVEFIDGLPHDDITMTINGFDFVMSQDKFNVSNGYYEFTNWSGEYPAVIDLWDDLQTNESGQYSIGSFSSQSGLSSPYTEYTKTATGWELIPWGIEEAPQDGIQYVRKNTTWQGVDLIAAGGVTDVSGSDGYYARRIQSGIKSWDFVPESTNNFVPIDKQLANADILNMAYDGSNVLTQIVYGPIDDLISGYTGNYNYDGAGTLTSIVIKDNSGSTQLTLVYSYDINGNLITFTRS